MTLRGATPSRGFWVYAISIWYTLTGMASLGRTAQALTPGTPNALPLGTVEAAVALFVATGLIIAGLSLYLMRSMALAAFAVVGVLSLSSGLRNVILHGTWVARELAIGYWIGILLLLAATAYTYRLKKAGRLE